MILGAVAPESSSVGRGKQLDQVSSGSAAPEDHTSEISPKSKSSHSARPAPQPFYAITVLQKPGA